MTPTPPTMVTPNLQLLRKLGEGGMGSVWVAMHHGLNSEVAVKFIRTEVAVSNPALVARFQREAEIAARLKSPHVVQVFDHGRTQDGTPFMAMELLEGMSLEARLRRDGTLPIEEVTVLVGQVCRVLHEARKKSVVHRDLKPANLFLIDAGYDLFVKVLDFGIAKNDEALGQVSVTSTASLLGSPLYMSPEQFKDPKRVDVRSDLWSLAVVAYHALVGRTCFAGDTLGQVMMAVLNRDYEPPSFTAALPVALDAFFDKALALEADERYQTPRAFAEAFELATHGASRERIRDVGTTVGFGSPAAALAYVPSSELSATMDLEASGVMEQPSVDPGDLPPHPHDGTLEPSVGLPTSRRATVIPIVLAALVGGAALALVMIRNGEADGGAPSASTATLPSAAPVASPEEGPSSPEEPPEARQGPEPQASPSASAVASSPAPESAPRGTVKVAAPAAAPPTSDAAPAEAPPVPPTPPEAAPPPEEERSGRIVF